MWAHVTRRRRFRGAPVTVFPQTRKATGTRYGTFGQRMYGADEAWAVSSMRPGPTHTETYTETHTETSGRNRPMGDHFKTDIGQLEQFLTNLERCVDELNEDSAELA